MERRLLDLVAALFAVLAVSSCGRPHLKPAHPLVPAIEYSNKIKNPSGFHINAHEVAKRRAEEANAESKRRVYLENSRPLPVKAADPEIARKRRFIKSAIPGFKPPKGPMAELSQSAVGSMQLYPYGPAGLNPADYNGPLSLGDPGQTASLWRNGGNNQEFFRDIRAWQPMDLITVKIVEKTEGKKEADTEVKSKSTVKAAIENLLGLAERQAGSHGDLSLDNLINAKVQNDYKGEGETIRKGSLKGDISCMVVEVLPSGILRIEGTKIIAVNDEEQIMVLTGLVRPRDISSDNVVMSTRVANMRIDYYGRGQLGDLQQEGWFGRLIRSLWPF
ncbi:MAG: flagellar basal body L-ring protein FlgH [Candidatus Dadabacteria bacterium]|nr:MAG: flagellar basal body L-ring protein FlgH [Candidatus Dadabacteria bacterium]